MVITHEYGALDAQHPHIWKPSVHLKFSRLAGSQVTEHAQVLMGPVKTASLNLIAGQVGYTVDCYKRFDDFLNKSYMDDSIWPNWGKNT